MRGLGTDHVILGPMRGLKNASDGPNKQTDEHRNSKAEFALQWPVSVKSLNVGKGEK